MSHSLVDQLHFTRSEWLRGLDGMGPEEGTRHLGPMNCISWMVGHLAWKEQAYWLIRAQGRSLFPELDRSFASGAPMTTPSLDETVKTWKEVVGAAEAYLDSLTTEHLQEELPMRGKEIGQTIGSAILRMTYHYWYHIGEMLAIRQMLGHEGLPEFVGPLEQQAPYRPG